MSIIIKLLLAACLLVSFTNSANADDSVVEPNASSADGKLFPDNDEKETNADVVRRPKRLYTAQIKAALDKINLSLEKSLDKSSLWGSIRSSSLLKSKNPSLLDTYKSSLLPGLSREISLTPLLSLPRTNPLIGTAASIKWNKPPTSNPILAHEFWGSAPLSDEIVGDSKPIVLPEHLQDKTQKKKRKPISNRITVKQLKETADLRNEINYAVKHNIYVHSSTDVRNMPDEPPAETPEEPMVTDTPIEPPPQVIINPFNFDSFSDFIHKLFGRKSIFKKLSKEPSLGDARSDFSYVPENPSIPTSHIDVKTIDPSPQEYAPNGYGNIDIDFDMSGFSDVGDYDEDASLDKMMAKIATQVMNEGIVSNTVESYANNADMAEIETSRVREELNMTSITEDMRFQIGENVIGWRTLQRNKHESHALIGLTNTSVVLVLEKHGTYTLISENPLLSRPTFFEVFTFWNHTQQSIDGIVIVSIQHEIVFLRINEAMDKMEIIWMWPTNYIANYLHHFVIDNSDTLLIITDLHVGSAASLYRFDMNQKAFYLRESLMLETKAKNMALIQTGYETLMCFPQKGHAVIYKFVEHHFKYFKSIESDHAEILSSFEMGGHSYLAIGGNRPKILRYLHGNFLDQTILSKSWGLVEFFLPVPARTYRDDLILFVQHRINYGSHTNEYVEALIWNGQAFHPALQVPCFVNEHESDLGLGCILDPDRKLGIIGATMFLRDHTISILVPRDQAPSGLFDLEIDLLPAVPKVNDHLLEELSEIMILLGTREEVLTNTQEFLDRFPQAPMKETTIKDKEVDFIYTQNLDMGSLIPTEGVFFNGEQITVEEYNEFLQLVDEAEELTKTLEELDRSKRETVKSLHIDSINVTELHARYINDIPVDDFIFIENGTLTIHGTAVVTDIEAEHVQRMPDDINFQLQQEHPETVTISGDLDFDEINGIKWKDFTNQIVLKHLPNSFDELVVHGTVFFKDAISVEVLNGVPFPSGYVFKDNPSEEEIVITGQKTIDTIFTSKMDTLGTFNGADLSDVVLLSTDQIIPGTTTFRQLEITEELVIGPNGTITGRHLDSFLSNPTIRETNQIRAHCTIDTLEIDGPLFVQDTMDGLVLDDVLSNVVYKHEKHPKINSVKRFKSVQAPNIVLTSKLLNGIPFSAFVTKDTEQTFDVSKLDANVYFQNVTTEGLFDFINITELDMNSIKVFGEQYTNADLIFKNGDYLNIDAARIDVLQTINGIDVRRFININENFELHGDVYLNGLNVTNLVVGGEIRGDPDTLVNGVNLKKLADGHFSKNNPQNITEPVHIKTLVVRSGFNADFINGFDFKEAREIVKNLKTNEQMLNESRVVVDQMFINGSVYFGNINGYDLEDIKQNAIRLDESNNIDFPIVFLDQIYVNGNMYVEELNGENFNAFVNDLVRKSANVTKIYGTTIFQENVTVLDDAYVTTINDLEVDRILTKNYKRVIVNPIRIYGDVSVPNLIVDGKLNGITADQIKKYAYDDESDTFILHKNVFFNQSVHTKYLELHGSYHDIGNFKGYFEDIIRTDRPAVIKGTKRFTNYVHFENSIDIGEYNGVNMPNFLSNIILIDQYEPAYINSDVVFEESVVMQGFTVDGDLITSTINNCSVKDWVKNSIRTDEPFTFDGTVIFSPDTFEATNIDTQFLNGYSMDDVLTLNTPQNFSYHVHFGDVHSFVPITTASGLVNGYNLKEERANTLMTYGDQYIEIPTIFSSVRVLKNLITKGNVNGRDLRRVATIGNSINVDSPLSFETVAVDRLYTKELISGINFDAWYENALQRQKDTPQIVTAPWTIKNAVIDTFIAENGINGMSAPDFLKNAEEIYHKHKNDYNHSCQMASDLIQDTQDNAIFISHFDKAFDIDTPNPINSIYLLSTLHQNYLVINSGCESFIYEWDLKSKQFVALSTVVTGYVAQWIHIEDAEDQLFLVSNNDGSIDSKCVIGGAFIWKFNPNEKTFTQELQFGQTADFRSMQIKPNSRAVFYVISNADNHVIEYNLQGAVVREWKIDEISAPITTSVKFLPGEANLGLALSHGNHLSILTSCNCTKQRTKRCGLLTEIDWHQLRNAHRQHFEKSIAQMRTHLQNGLPFLKSILSSNEFNARNGPLLSRFNQPKINSLKELTRKSNERTSQILSSTMADSVNSSEIVGSVATESAQNATKPNTDGQLNVGLMNAIDDGAANKTISTPGKTENATQQTESDDKDSVVGTGENLVNLMDMIQKLIEKNREKYKQGGYDADAYEDIYTAAMKLNETEMGKIVNYSSVLNELNQTDPQVGTLFGMLMLENTLAQTLDRASKIILGDNERGANDEIANFFVPRRKSILDSLLGSSHRQFPYHTDHYHAILDALEGIRCVSSQDSANADETQVGDKFGDIMFKLTPIVDKLFDEIVDEMRRRDYQSKYDSDAYSVGSTLEKIGHIEEMDISLKNNSRIKLKKIDVIFIIEMMDAIDATAGKSISGENSVGSVSGADLVNIIDLIDEIIQKNREKHQKSYDVELDYNYDNENSYSVASSLNKTELSQLLNDSLSLHQMYLPSNAFDRTVPRVGSVFGALLVEKAVIDKASNEFFRSKKIETNDEEKSPPQLENDAKSSNSIGKPVEQIFNMIAQAENITQEANLKNTNDPSVGDAFGDLMYKLTPVADEIIDNIVEELRRREYDAHYQQDPYSVGSAQPNTTESVAPKMYSVFRKIGNAVVKVYVFGKKHYRNAINLGKDVKHLYNIYHHRFRSNDTDSSTISPVFEDKKYKIEDNRSTTDSPTHVKPPSESTIDDSIEKEYEIISKLMPNTTEFATAFAIKMIKSFIKSENHQNDDEHFWSLIKNGVDAALNKHANTTNQTYNAYETKLNKTQMDDVIYKNFENHLKNEIVESSAENVGESLTELSAASSTNEELLVGEDLLSKFTPLFDHLSDKIVDELRERPYSESQSNNPDGSDVTQVNIDTSTDEEDEVEDESLESITDFENNGDVFVDGTQDIVEVSKDHDYRLLHLSHQIISDSGNGSIDHIFSMIDGAENMITNSEQSSESQVGKAKLGDLTENLTPVAADIIDDIIDEIEDELRRRNYEERYQQYERDPYMVGSAKDIEDTADESESKVNKMFRKVSNALVNVYVFGQKHYRNAKNYANKAKKWARDATYLYNTYFFDNVIEDNLNDNKSYGPPDDVDDSNQDLKERMAISKIIPNATNFTADFTVEMVKSFIGSNKLSRNQSFINNSNVWSLVRNAAKTAFEMHANDSDQHKTADDTEQDKQIYEDVLHTIKEMVEDFRKSNTSSEETVGLTHTELASNETENPLDGDKFGDLHKKLTPLINHLSDRIVKRVYQKQHAVDDSKQETLESVSSQPNDMVDSNEDERSLSLSGSRCNRKITMEEFEEKLIELKGVYGPDYIFSLLRKSSPSKTRAEKRSQIEATIVSIPHLSLPSHQNAEIVAIRVGSDQRLLIAVSSVSEHKIKSEHDRILIYEDVIDGKMFQTISCFKPSSLTTFTVNEDTILAFIQDINEVKTYVYRGAQGFVEFTSFQMPSPIKKMIHYEIATHPMKLICPEHFLILIMGNRAVFLRAVTIGDCKINANLEC